MATGDSLDGWTSVGTSNYTEPSSSQSDGVVMFTIPEYLRNTLTKSIFKNGRFVNPWKSWREPTFWTLVQWKMLKKAPPSDFPKIPSQDLVAKHLHVGKPDFVNYNNNNNNASSVTSVNNKDMRFTWLGHATCLVEMDGFSVITDPMFSNHCTPMPSTVKSLESSVGTNLLVDARRFLAPGCQIDELPDSLRFVVISHNHYDHLDADSVSKIAERFGSRLTWCVPLGLKRKMQDLLPDYCSNSIYEFDWWQGRIFPLQTSLGGETANSDTNTSTANTINKKDLLDGDNVKKVKIIATPSQHWSVRDLFDRNTSLWNGWCIVGPSQRKFWFAGDTGYCEVFKQIGNVFETIDLAAIPIGAFEPRDVMEPQHVNPDEAVKIHHDVKSKLSFGVHWGTFPMADEGFMEPEIQLMKLVGFPANVDVSAWKKSASRKSLSEMIKESNIKISFVTVNCGQTYSV